MEDYYMICFKIVTKEYSDKVVNLNTRLIVENLNIGAYDRFNILKKSGDGSFGRVYKARNKANNGIVSLKILNVELDDYNNNVRNEALILKWLNHKNIIKFYEEVLVGDQVILVTEHCDGGDFSGRIQKQ
ncbi:Cell division protein kinase 5 [Entamoeba marina]